MNTDDERDDLWQLLGRAPGPKVSPFFARNVVREVRNLPQGRPDVAGWLRRWWRVATLTATCAVVALAFGLPVLLQPHSKKAGRMAKVNLEAVEEHQLIAMAEEVMAGPDLQVIGNLDDLLGEADDNAIWLSSDVTSPSL